MRLSHLTGTRFKETPAEAQLASHIFLLRGGYARQMANGIFSLLLPGLRVTRKIERIIREEMDAIGGQEVQMPVALPRELWELSGRYGSIGAELLRFQDRAGHDMVLAMTHEEAVVALCRNEIKSYSQLPFMMYQIQTKFRDEPRSRGGLIRAREFTMKDAYSFHASQDDLEVYYQQAFRAYMRIFQRVGLPEVVAVESDTGMMGGEKAHEFELPADCGEDTIVVCNRCDYKANREVARGKFAAFPEEPLPLQKVHTPQRKTIEEVASFLNVSAHKTAKAVLYESDSEGKLVFALIRGDLDVNEAKVVQMIKTAPLPASEDRIASVGAVPGYATVMGLDLSRIRLLVDHTLAESGNLVCGANEVDYHYLNFNLARDLPGVSTIDIAQVAEGARCIECGGELKLKRGIEVGNIFQLGTKYTEAMDMTFTDANGKACHPTMGCYGIGVGRLMASVIETRHDQYGPQWPMAIAPWQVHLNALKLAKPSVKECAEKLYENLQGAGVEVLYDDRDATPGVQFADADLLGVPIRLIVSERNLAQNQVEFKHRDTGETGTVPLENAVVTVTKWINESL